MMYPHYQCVLFSNTENTEVLRKLLEWSLNSKLHISVRGLFYTKPNFFTEEKAAAIKDDFSIEINGAKNIHAITDEYVHEVAKLPIVNLILLDGCAIKFASDSDVSYKCLTVKTDLKELFKDISEIYWGILWEGS